MYHMNMYRFMLIGIKVEDKSEIFKNLGHICMILIIQLQR